MTNADANPFLRWVISQVQSGDLEITNEEVRDTITDIVAYQNLYVDMTIGVGNKKRVRLVIGSPPSKLKCFWPRVLESLGL